ncbi:MULTISPECIES: hypothetical protein [unclassified Kribbella]
MRYGGYAHPKGGDTIVLFIGIEQKNSDPEQGIEDFSPVSRRAAVNSLG